MFLKWFLIRKLLYNYQYIHNLFFQKRTYPIAATIPATPVLKNTLLVVSPTHPLKRTYFMDGPYLEIALPKVDLTLVFTSRRHRPEKRHFSLDLEKS